MPMRPIAINITQDVHLKQDVSHLSYHPTHTHHHRKASVPESMRVEVEDAGSPRGIGDGGGDDDVKEVYGYGDSESGSVVYETGVDKSELGSISPPGEADLERREDRPAYHAV